MNTLSLLNFLDSMEKQGLLSTVANRKIQEFLDYSTQSVGKLFLVITALIGAGFISAGVFSIISHNWDDFPKHVRGVLSFIPSLVALYFYYLAVFKHSKSTSWIEASSLFLMLMMGATMALVSQTYQMDGDFDRFIKVWLILTLPLFYIARASGIAFFYLLLSCKFLYPHFNFGLFGPSEFALNENYYYFWMFFAALLPHFFLSLNRKSNHQGFRSIYLGWLIGVVFLLTLPLTVKSGYIWWSTAAIIGYYLIGKKYYASNISSLGRPFQTITLLFLFSNLNLITNKDLFPHIFGIDGLRSMENWNNEQYFFFFTGLVLLFAVVALSLYMIKKGIAFNRYVIYIPFLVILLYGIYCLDEFADFDMKWFAFLLLNFYILGFGINALIKGKNSKNVLYMFYGLFMISNLMWMRYFDMDISFWLKGIFFIGVGLIFLLIHYLSADEFEA